MELQDYFKGTYGTMYYVKDMNKALNFYKDKLGFKCRLESPDWSEFEMPNGQAICLHKTDGSMKQLPGGVMILNVVKLRELITKLKKTGVHFDGEPHNVHAEDYTINFVDQD